jgi:hypothetical protein
MIVTDHFVYIHTSRSAGTFLNNLIIEEVPGARMIQYHGHLKDLPEKFSHLPVIGFVRNPWDWYVSMFYDYRRKQQYVFQIISERDTLGFEATISRFLRLGDSSAQSDRLLQQLSRFAPPTIGQNVPPRLRNPGLRAKDFESYTNDEGYYTWLFRLMYETERKHQLHLGRFENLREEALRLFEETGTPITRKISDYLQEAKPLNSSPRPEDAIGAYPPELEQLVAEKDKHIVERFGFRFSEPNG